MWKRLVLLLILVSVPLSAGRAEFEVVEKIAAVVEDEVITATELAEQLQLYLLELKIAPDDMAAVDSLQGQVLRELIDGILIVKEAERKEIEVSEDELDLFLEQHLEQQMVRFGGEQGFMEQLEREGVSLRQMKAFYRKDIRRQVLSSRLVGSEIDTDVEVLDDDVRVYFDDSKETLGKKPEQIRLRHLLIQPKPTAERELDAVNRLEDARARLLAGEDFASLAREYSRDPSAARGGDIGFFAEGDLDPVFTEVAFSLADSEQSDVVRTGYGYHIIQRLATRGDEIHVRHIVIPMDVTADDIARARGLVETVTSRLEEGADFIELIRAYSDAPEADGDVGSFSVEGLFPHFRAALEALGPGEVSEFIEDAQGFHIFQVIERTPAEEYTFEEVEPTIREFLRRQQLEDRYNTWTAELRGRSYVEVREL